MTVTCACDAACRMGELRYQIMSHEDVRERFQRARALLSQVTRVVYLDLPADVGIADETGEVPEQREYYCLIDTAAGPACLATLVAVGTKVLCFLPHAGSGLCSRCEYIDAWEDGQSKADALFRSLLMSPAVIEPIQHRDRAACVDPAPHLCPDCQHRPRSDSERPMERMS
jgi:hypothetical protein